MNDNLSQMVKETPVNENVFSEADLDIPDIENTIQVATSMEEQTSNSIEITSLSEWFDSNVDNFPNLRKPTVSIQGVDSNEQLIVIVVSTDNNGAEKCKLLVFDDANIIPVLNLPAMDMQAYSNGFRIVYDLGNGIFIKSYGVRKGLISVFCHDVNDLLIPYAVSRSKKNDEYIEIISPDIAAPEAKLAEALDQESLQLRYKQSNKAEGLNTNLDAVKWLIEKQSDIEDINHHLQIDNVIIDSLI